MSSGPFKEHVATVASISRYDSQGEDRTGASYRSQLHQSQNVTYDFSIDGGAIANHNLELKYAIPAGALVYASTMYATTTVTSGGALTGTVGVVAAGDLNAAAATIAQVNAGWHEPRVGAVAPVVTTAETTNVIFTIAAAAATAGVVYVNIEYLLPGDA